MGRQGKRWLGLRRLQIAGKSRLGIIVYCFYCTETQISSTPVLQGFFVFQRDNSERFSLPYYPLPHNTRVRTGARAVEAWGSFRQAARRRFPSLPRSPADTEKQTMQTYAWREKTPQPDREYRGSPDASSSTSPNSSRGSTESTRPGTTPSNTVPSPATGARKEA